MECPQRWQSLCIHFTLQELFWLGKPASHPVGSLERSCKCLPGRNQMGHHSPTTASSALPTGKLQKIISAIYQKAEFPTLLQQAPQKFKYSAPQKKTCLPGEGKDREKAARSSIGSSGIAGCMWIVVCDGRGPSSILQASSGLFGQVSPSQFIGLARSCLLE